MFGLLKELEIDENTIVFYTSDNGPNTPFLEPLNSAAGLRGIKRSLYEGGIRAAMIVKWPGKVAAGKTNEFQWDMRDIFPTLYDIANIEAPNNLDGISVLPAILGQEQSQRSHLYWEYHSPFQQAVRMGDWKGIRFGTMEPVELYDLSEDFSESDDIASGHPKVVAEMIEIMNNSRTESPFWPTFEYKRK